MITKIYLVDCENAGFRKIEVDKPLSTQVYYFTNAQQPIKGIDDTYETTINYKHNSTKDALDFVIDTFLGFQVARFGKEVEYIIVSGDKGFCNVIGFWQVKGYKIRRQGVGSIESVKQPSNAKFKTNMLVDVKDNTINSKTENSEIVTKGEKEEVIAPQNSEITQEIPEVTQEEIPQTPESSQPAVQEVSEEQEDGSKSYIEKLWSKMSRTIQLDKLESK
jgi:hypothetical protein